MALGGGGGVGVAYLTAMACDGEQRTEDGGVTAQRTDGALRGHAIVVALLRRAEVRFTLYAFVFTASAIAFIHVRTWSPDTDLSIDAPYHIGMADLFSDAALRRRFSWTRLSIWHEQFYDKELGFHALLSGIRRWAGLFGYSGERPPFVLETAVLLLMYMGTLTWALLRLGVKRPAPFIVLGVLACPLFCVRINMVRPHVLSIILTMLTTVRLAAAERDPPFWPVAGFGVLFAYCHSNPHFILFPAGCYAMVTLKQHGWRALRPCAGAVAGVLAGLTIHPQVPNTFLVWKIQCIDVVWQALSGSVPVRGPLEFGALSPLQMFHNGLLPVMVGACVAGMLPGARWRRMPHANRLVAAMMLVAFAAFFLAGRVIEYALPSAVLMLGLVCEDLFSQRREAFHAAAAAGVFVVCGLLVPLHVDFFRGGHFTMPRQFAVWARANVVPGTYIANLRFEDFPGLFFCAPEFVYSYGLDPMFMYAAHPEEAIVVDRTTRPDSAPPEADVLRRAVRTRYVFVSDRYHKLARKLAEKRYALAYQGVDGWVFDLDAPPVDHRLGKQLSDAP